MTPQATQQGLIGKPVDTITITTGETMIAITKQEKQSVRQALRTGRDVPQQKRTIITRKAYRRSI